MVHVGRSRSRRRWMIGIVATGLLPALVYVGLGLGGSDTAATVPAPSPPVTATESPTVSSTPAATPSSTPVPEEPPQATQGEALAALESLPVKGRAAKTGYDREQFGPAWSDVDGNGCDTRNDVLARDLSDTVVDADRCTVRAGLLAGPYSRDWIRFARGENTSALVQVDHVVALSDAWQKGAQQLTPQRRLQLANDPVNLLAVDGGLNQQKGDGDAATWLPPNTTFRCEYVARQVAVKQRYDLWVTAAERDAIARVLSGCPEQGLPTAAAPTGIRPEGSPPPAGASAVSGAPTAEGAFANCTEARAAGAAPVRRQDPGYGPHLDGDNDGIGCE